MVSHLLFAQYPTTKVIKGERVVIMKLEQANDIDNKFIKLKDSIYLLKNINKENEKNFTDNINKYDLKILEKNDSILSLKRSNNEYLNEINKYKKLEFEDKKVQKRLTIGMIATGVTWLFIFLASNLK